MATAADELRGGAVVRAEPLLWLDVAVGPPVEVGVVDGALRRCIPIVGGNVAGDYRGEVLPGGADWQRISADGGIELSARYVLEVTEGRIEVESTGVRHGSPEVLAKLAVGEPVPATDYYFRTSMRFRAATPALARLNHVLAVARGERLVDRVLLTVFEVT